MPTNVCIGTPCLFVASFVILVAGFCLAFAKTPVGPAPGKYMNRVTLLVCVYFSSLAFSFGLFTNAETLGWHNFATPVANSLRMMHSSGGVPTLSNGGINDSLFDFIVVYEQVLYLLAPVSTLIAIAQLLQEAGSFARMRRRSIWNDTFVLTPLNARTLELAKDIKRCYMEPSPGQSHHANVVFVGVRARGDEPLMDGVREHGFVTLEQPLEMVIERLLRTMGFRSTVLIRRLHGAITSTPHAGRIFVMFDNDDEPSNVARAIALQRQLGAISENLEVQIFAVAQQPSAQAHVSSSKPHFAAVRYIDWTLGLAQKTLSDYPLFLHGMQPPLPQDGSANSDTASAYLTWQRCMLERNSYHVVVVGAGHVGTEFLLQALAHSRIWGTSFAFDVLDSIADPGDKDACIAQQLVNARAPELLSETHLCAEDAMRQSVEFHRCDVSHPEFEKFIEKRAETISYVFVCLGEDTLTIQTALKTNEVLERALVRRCATNTTAGNSREALRHHVRPLVIGVVGSNNLAHALTRTADVRNGQLRFVGSPSSMYTFSNMIAAEPRNTDYERRQSYASRIHAKYRVFACAKKLLETEADDLSCLPIDWRADFLHEAAKGRRGTGAPQPNASASQSSICLAIERYNVHCEDEHDWLLRMEHARWCTCTRAMGYCRATEQQLDAYFGNDDKSDSPHRNEDALLHPYLVPFDELEYMDEHVAALRKEMGLPPAESHLDKGRRHIRIR